MQRYVFLCYCIVLNGLCSRGRGGRCVLPLRCIPSATAFRGRKERFLGAGTPQGFRLCGRWVDAVQRGKRCRTAYGSAPYGLTVQLLRVSHGFAGAEGRMPCGIKQQAVRQRNPRPSKHRGKCAERRGKESRVGGCCFLP